MPKAVVIRVETPAGNQPNTFANTPRKLLFSMMSKKPKNLSIKLLFVVASDLESA